MALVIFFVPEPAERRRRNGAGTPAGGVAAAYAWDMPAAVCRPQQCSSELRALGHKPAADAQSRRLAHRYAAGVVDRAGFEQVETRKITVQRTFADLDEFIAMTALCAERHSHREGDVTRRSRAAEGAYRRAVSGGRRGPHHTNGVRQCGERPSAEIAGRAASVVCLCRPKLRVDARVLQAALGEPCRSAVLGARDQLAGLREIVGRTFQRAERRRDVILDLRIEGLKLADQLPRDQQSQRMQSGRDRASRRLLQCAGIAGGQDDEPLRAARDRDLDACCW